MKTLEELHQEGIRLSRKGHLVVFLTPSQQWMALELQTPFLRYDGMNYQQREGNVDETA